MVRIDNYTKNDIFLPVMGTYTVVKRKPLYETVELKQGNKTVTREIVARDEFNTVVMQDFEEVYESVVNTIHVPPKLKNTKNDECCVEVEKDIAKVLQSHPTVQHMVDKDQIRFTALASDS